MCMHQYWGWLVGGTVVLSVHVPVLGMVGRWHSSAKCACTSTGMVGRWHSSAKCACTSTGGGW